ncbi:hypothetical protein [Halarchaeum sp. P4]|uniref:hypothetical protein n=1 Tax=Halarchaeum sp. P4 TaxID=3421639 RepID=UPI003EC03C5E
MTDATARLRRPAGTATGRRDWRPALAALALLAAAVPFARRLVVNLPGTVVPGLASAYGASVTVAVLGPALAAAGLALGTTDRVERVSLVALAVFAPLTLAADAAYLPAAGIVTLAGGVAVWRRLTRVESTGLRRVGRALLGVAAVAAIGCSLAAAVGLAPASVRQTGTVLALGAAVATGVAADADMLDWSAGALAASLAYALGTSAPYVTGAVALVVGGVVGASLPLLVAALGGVTAATVASVRQRAVGPACGALLVLVAGAPVTVPRALAAVLGVVVVLGGVAE